MNRARFLRDARLIVDVCREHGTWFDADRLARALRVVDSGGLERSQRAAVDEKRATDESIEQQRRNLQEKDRQFHAKRAARVDATRKGALLLHRLGRFF
jgi:hypothetical protein